VFSSVVPLRRSNARLELAAGSLGCLDVQFGYNLPVSATATIRVKVLFFGRLKEVVGRSEDSVDLANGAAIESLFAHYAAGNPQLAGFRASVVASRNQEFAAWSTPLAADDEIAFLPPVSGG
jgi:sulfur-carrier protein